MPIAEACVLIVMGVSGSGKSTTGRALAQELGWRFMEGDDLHPPANIARMRAGHPLTDADRAPWLDRIHAEIEAAVAADRPTVIACSALKRRYRDRLSAGLPSVAFVALEGEAALLERRLAGRAGHFMPAALLASQLATYEPPTGDERALVVAAGEAQERQVAAIRSALGR